MNVRPVYKRVDTCAAEFSTDTAYPSASAQTTACPLPARTRYMG
ncbi:hypothetical protein [Limnohabitans sp. Rim11]|nr:hypothetical protein [Limnohabitans sp. Rim11]